MLRFRGTILALVAILALAACESSEERAERHYQQALASLEAGEVELALVDLRRVFDYNGFHHDARALYAQTVREQGNFQEAYGQYLRLVEQYPDDFEGRVALAEMAFSTGNWEELERHGGKAAELNAKAPEVAPLVVAIDFREAALANDAEAMTAAADKARVVLARDDSNDIARRVLISYLLEAADPSEALAEIDRALEATPDDFDLNIARLNLLGQMQDEAGTDAQLKRMFALFPENEMVQQSLLRWYLARGNTEEAEAFLRELAALNPENPAGFLSVVKYIQQVRGGEAAQAELETLIAETPEGAAQEIYRASLAALIFDGGDQEAGMARIREIISGAEPGAQTNDIKMMYVRMLEHVGDAPAARELVDEILTADSAHVESLKRKAAWAIDGDRAGDAISDLRRALDQAPRDAEILTLMAHAHEREGSLELAGERLSLAVEASGQAVPESLRYARFLLAQGSPEPARQVLDDALRKAPVNLDIIGLLAEIAVAEEDWAKADELSARLASSREPAAQEILKTLTSVRLLAEGQVEQVLAQLEEQIADAGGMTEARRATATLVLLKAREGDIDGARLDLAVARSEDPDDLSLRQLEVLLDLGSGETEAAEEKLRGIVADSPGARQPVEQLFGLLTQQGRTEEAEALIAEELARSPDSSYLRLMQGTILSDRGDIPGAIALFDELYAENSSNVIVANNLATLLADDPAELERATTIARRLRGRDIPAFQDTYGWIAFLRGNVEDAIANLEPAAAGLTEDALVQYHLGRAYEAAERMEEARAQYARALELSEGTEIADLAQFADAQKRLMALDQ
ncbi:tetratricopeptide repeat protein [Tropicimonas sp. TH_r6]|uniref:tetratricopeptide repeat protein n=1 Tax=Tropicimonas sp. TH_r6 TaxID=3082085 RepID=UPI0029535293|nr:tetratricopeptide repeat protein [Tropicimonas sp. TH_r6]MDV7145559.1 tetratricopeptide repeat protein [Tropicimonas sp. TH_r6]